MSDGDSYCEKQIANSELQGIGLLDAIFGDNSTLSWLESNTEKRWVLIIQHVFTKRHADLL